MGNGASISKSNGVGAAGDDDGDVIRLLLLGPGESGKSTVLKQMRILHASGFTPAEREDYVGIVRKNLMDAVLSVFAGMDSLGLSFDPGDGDKMKRLRLLLVTASQQLDYHFPFPGDILHAIEDLKLDSGVAEALSRGAEFNLPHSAPYYLAALSRINDDGYVPSTEDILHVRIRTINITQDRIPYKDLTIVVTDVGGQRTERRKWLHYFDNTHAVMFIAAIGSYDQVIVEDNETNRVVEGVYLFDTICNCEFFIKSAMILFLNKIDLFEEKLKTVPLNIAFPKYKGSQSYTECSDYVRRQFESKNRAGKKTYTHLTCATDTRQIEFIMIACFDVIMAVYLKSVGLG